MKRIYIQDSWPDIWKNSYAYDLEEIYGEITQRGYALAYEIRRREAFDLLTGALPKGARILDLAAAQGNFSLPLAEMGYRVVWNDMREELIDYVKMKYEHGDITYVPGNAFELGFPVPFDGIVITEIIEHVAHPDAFLRKVAQLVRPGGYIVMTTPNGAYFRSNLPKFSDCPDPGIYESVQFKPNSDGHIFLLHPEEIPVLGDQAGLALEKLVLCINPLSAGHVKTAPLLGLLPAGFVSGLETMTRRWAYPLRKKVSSHLAALYRKIG
jgi:2-polyprenyl-6-hydroxyphenyl methylase/3-demethylubiquinone-9 3-methyltransferase